MTFKRCYIKKCLAFCNRRILIDIRASSDVLFNSFDVSFFGGFMDIHTWSTRHNQHCCDEYE